MVLLLCLGAFLGRLVHLGILYKLFSSSEYIIFISFVSSISSSQDRFVSFSVVLLYLSCINLTSANDLYSVLRISFIFVVGLLLVVVIMSSSGELVDSSVDCDVRIVSNLICDISCGELTIVLAVDCSNNYSLPYE